MVTILGAFAGLLLLLLALKLTQRLTLRLKVLAGVTVSRNAEKSCPHLGHAADPFTHGNGPADEHRCYLYMQRDRIDLLHQKSFCLSTAHHKCPWLMIRRPDAPPPLRQRLRRALAGGPAQLWGGAWAGVKGVPALAMAAVRGLGRGVGRLWSGVRFAARGIDIAMSVLGSAIRSVGGDALSGVGHLVRGLAEAVAHVGSDLWSSTQRAGVVVASLARLIRFAVQALSWLVRTPARGIVHMTRAMRASQAARAEQRHAAAQAQAAPAVAEAASPVQPLPIDERKALAELFPGLDLSELEEPMAEQAAAAAPPVLEEPAGDPVLAGTYGASIQPPADAITQRLEAPLARFEELLARLESLVSDGVSALDHGQESLAYELFLKATEQQAKLPQQAAPELRDQHTSLMTRAWFWRAKTAETVEEVVDTLDQALKYEPGNLQIQAHLAWARQRLERDRRVQEGSAEAASIQRVDLAVMARRRSIWRGLGLAIRMAGGFMALALAALWMTTGVLPALGSWLSQLPAGDELMLRRLMLTVNAAALPGQGHLALPMFNYDLGLSLPFVLAFLFVFTARGLMDGDTWARTGGLVLAGIGGWLCAAAVSNPDASRLGLALCVGVIVAAVVGRFDSPKVTAGAHLGY